MTQADIDRTVVADLVVAVATAMSDRVAEVAHDVCARVDGDPGVR
jgi:hypothetical protein